MKFTLTPKLSRVGFFLFGFALSLICFWIGVRWPDIGEWLFGGFNFATQPGWFYIAGEVLSWLPWILAGALVLLRISRTLNVRPISYIVGTICAYVVIFTFLLGAPIASDYSQRRPFDSELWKKSLADPQSDDPIRLHMVDDLLRKHRLAGLTRSEVMALLGQPPSTDKFSDWDLVYWLGPERGFIAIDSEWLVIRFDKNGKVSEARDVSD